MESNIGPFARLLEKDHRDGRLHPEVWAADIGADPSYVSRMRKGGIPLPAALIPSIVTHTGNRAYLEVLAGELGLQVVEAVEELEGEAHLRGLAVRLVTLAPSVLTATARWLGAPQKEGWLYLQRVIERAEKVNRVIDIFLSRARGLAAKCTSR